MATSVESSSPASLNKGSARFAGSSPIFKPSSDKRFWSNLRSRVDTLIESRKPIDHPHHPFLLSTELKNDGAAGKRLKEDAMLLMRGFDSVTHSLSHLSNNLENALQGTRDLRRPPTLTEILHCSLEEAKEERKKKKDNDRDEAAEEESGETKRGLKRKSDPQDSVEDKAHHHTQNDNKGKKSLKELGSFNKAKNLAILMATKASALAWELKSLKSDMCFVQERCGLLEEENRRLRDGFANDTRPDEDDLVRLQMEALLSEKSRLANENSNLARENQCLRQLVEYHQLTAQDLSASYESLVRGMGLDFSTPVDEEEEDPSQEAGGVGVARAADRYKLFKNLDECYDDDDEED